jgi:putative transposase
VARTHSRPHVSNDNPFSEAAFKTLKYCPAFPDHFDDIEHARAFCKEFFDFYNHEHYHSGLGLHTPASVHYGTAESIRAIVPKSSPLPTPATPSASAGVPSHPSCRPLRGSTHPASRLHYRTTDNSVSKKS